VHLQWHDEAEATAVVFAAVSDGRDMHIYAIAMVGVLLESRFASDSVV
jgi:hypothetical protein